MTSKETLKLVAKGGLVLLCALIVIIASAGSLNYGAPTTGQQLTSTITVQHNGYLFGAFRVEAQN